MSFKNKLGVIKKAVSALWWVVVILLIALLIHVLGAKFRGEVPKIFGYSVLRIISGSMEDEISAGDYILIKECDPEDIVEGDIISFYSDEPMIYGIPNTHRVIAVNQGEEGPEFTTRGDANPIDDRVTAKADRLIGKYDGKLKLLTAFASVLDGSGMFIFMIILQAATLTVIVLTCVKQGKNAPPDGGGDDETDVK